jgi:hypothetical protein
MSIKKAPNYLEAFLWAHLESNQAPTDYTAVHQKMQGNINSKSYIRGDYNF